MLQKKTAQLGGSLTQLRLVYSLTRPTIIASLNNKDEYDNKAKE
jgi:hypothetical protein